MEIRADRRRRHVEHDPERVRQACAVAADYRATKVRMAKLLVAIERGGDHLLRGYSSVRDFAARELGLPGVDIPMLLGLGRALSPPLVTEGERDGESAGGAGPADALVGPEGETSTDNSPAGNAPDDPLEPDASEPDASEPNDGAPASDSVEDRVTSGELSLENIAQLDRLWRALGGAAGGHVTDEQRSRWMHAAESVSPYKFRQMVRRAIEDAGQPEPTVHLPLQVTESARDDFRRAKDLASRRARRVLTDGQVFAVVVRSYIANEDPSRVGEKKRRAGPTKLLPGKRYVPAAVVRAIRERSGDRCEVPGCSHGGFLELMHVGRSHAQGGGREVRDLAEGCSTHHVLLDAGVIRFAGWSESGKPRFRTMGGRLLRTPSTSSAAGAQRPADQERCPKSDSPSTSRRARAPPA